MGRLGDYVGFTHLLKERFREGWSQNEGEGESNFRSRIRCKLEKLKEETLTKIHRTSRDQETDFSHITRPKTRAELARISAAVMGIEFSYAAETAFVSPLLLNLGLRHRHMTLIWILSPILGLFITPILGSLSDGCTSPMGRRRPFILLLSVGIIMGLLLVPNGKAIGLWFGDEYPETGQGLSDLHPTNATWISSAEDDKETQVPKVSPGNHPWGILITILGTVLLDFDADACQSPSRAYMLDITIPEDHARGLSTFTIMAGFGGSLGYFLGALNWENTFMGDMFGGHVRAVFTLVLFLFIACVVTTVRSFREMPYAVNSQPMNSNHDASGYLKLEESCSYGTVAETTFTGNTPLAVGSGTNTATDQLPTFRQYLATIIRLPRSLQWLCFTNFFSWMSLVCYSLYFTDFVGEAVFGGDPTAPRGSPLREKYEDGVRFGCWGMSLYSLSCSFYSTIIDRLINRFGAKRTYFHGHLIYAIGMVFMGLVRAEAGVILFSWTAGVMYATLFTMPYLLVARYHAAETFDIDAAGSLEQGEQAPEMRGLGTDVAIVSSMVFLAQITQSLVLGNIVTATGSTTTIVFAAAIFASCGAIASTKVLYLDI